MSELFDEVDEEVRREQLKKLWDQYSIYIVAGALLIIAAVGGWRGYQYLEAQEGGRGRCCLRQGRRTLRAEQARRGGSGLYRSGCEGAIGISHAGAVACRSRSQQAAIHRRRQNCTTTYRRIAASARRSRILPGSAPPDCCWKRPAIPACLQRLEAATAPGATFRHTARELLALSAWRANDTAAARQVAGSDCQ